MYSYRDHDDITNTESVVCPAATVVLRTAHQWVNSHLHCATSGSFCLSHSTNSSKQRKNQNHFARVWMMAAQYWRVLGLELRVSKNVWNGCGRCWPFLLPTPDASNTNGVGKVATRRFINYLRILSERKNHSAFSIDTVRSLIGFGKQTNTHCAPAHRVMLRKTCEFSSSVFNDMSSFGGEGEIKINFGNPFGD